MELELKKTGKKDMYGREIYIDPYGYIYKNIGDEICTVTESGEPLFPIRNYTINKN